MPKPASTRPAYKMLTCIYLCRTLLFFAPYADFLYKDNDISKTIRELICILLAHKELSGITYGTREADSRMATTTDMENLIDVLSEWSETPTDYFKLANILLKKNKELGYIPEEREIKDYLK